MDKSKAEAGLNDQSTASLWRPLLCHVSNLVALREGRTYEEYPFKELCDEPEQAEFGLELSEESDPLPFIALFHPCTDPAPTGATQGAA